MKKLQGLLAGIALLASCGAGQAATFTSDHCTNGCGPQATGFANITGSQVDANTVSITIDLLNGNGLVGGNGGLTTFTFNNTTDQAITFNFGLNAALFDVSNSLTNTASPGNINNDGLGQFEYGFNYIGGNGGSNPYYGSLTFTLSAVGGLSLASFSELSTIPPGDLPSYLALDIISGTNGRTGVVDCCAPGITPFDVNPVPIPAVGAGLPGIIAGAAAFIAWGRRRKKKQAASQLVAA